MTNIKVNRDKVGDDMLGYAANNHFDVKNETSKIRTKCDDFVKTVSPFTQITDEASYQIALLLLEDTLENADEKDMSASIVINLLTDAIDKYENTIEDVIEFEKEVDQIDPATSTLRLLMSQHNLKNKDLKDLIGSDSLISMILKGDRELTRKHISNLSVHFGISPSLFF